MEEIDSFKEGNHSPGTNDFSVDIAFSILTLVTKL
jgi:hypothetical protein